MDVFNVVFIIVLVQAVDNRKRNCDVNADDPSNDCFFKETLLTMSHSPHQLAFDRELNTLYFSFDSEQGEYIPALFNLNTKQLTVLKGVKDAFAIAYDPIDKEMYFGGTHGIYRFNTNLRSLKRLNMKNLDIWWLFVKDEVNFIRFPSLNLYSFRNGSIQAYPGLSDNVVHQMVVDRDNNAYFINNTGLYGIKTDGSKVALSSHRFINMAADNDGNVYVCSEDGIYMVANVMQDVKRLISLRGVLGLTFDNHNNIIYSDSHEIVRLVAFSKALL